MTFKADPAGIRALGDDPRLHAFMDNIGRDAVAAAKDIVDVDTGKLRDSIDYRVEREDGLPVTTVYFGKFYGMFKEFGTSTHPARPFLRPGVLKVIGRRGGRLGDD